MSDFTSSTAAVVADTIVRTVELGVTITDAAVDGETTVVFCDLLDDGMKDCPGCGADGVYRDTVIRRVTDVPVVGHPMRLHVRVPRYRCVNSSCEREVFTHNTDRLARRGWSTTRRCARYICRRLMIDRATVAAVARELGLSWDTVNTIAMDATQMIVATDTTRLDGVRVLGVDEHRWSHTRRRGEDGYVTVIIDLTPVLDGTGRARLLDLVPGRSAAAFKDWLAQQSAAFRDQVKVVAMDGFSGYKNATADQLPEATPELDLCRQRIQQLTCGHRGRKGDPLYGVRRILRTRLPLLSARRKAKLEAVFADANHLAVEVCWGFYQRLIAAYAHPDRRRGKAMMAEIIDSLRTGVPEALEELAQLGRTLWRRRADVLAYFDHNASNGPTEAINGRLEALRRNALGFRNLTHYRIRSLLHCGNLAQRIDAL